MTDLRSAAVQAREALEGAAHWMPAGTPGRTVASALAALDRALAATPAPQPGWKFVPVEPTPEMLAMADGAFHSASIHMHRQWRRHEAHAAAYRAMLAVAPPCPNST